MADGASTVTVIWASDGSQSAMPRADVRAPRAKKRRVRLRDAVNLSVFTSGKNKTVEDRKQTAAVNKMIKRSLLQSLARRTLDKRKGGWVSLIATSRAGATGETTKGAARGSAGSPTSGANVGADGVGADGAGATAGGPEGSASVFPAGDPRQGPGAKAPPQAALDGSTPFFVPEAERRRMAPSDHPAAYAAFLAAARADETAKAIVLLKKGVDPRVLTGRNKTPPLIIAAKRGNLDLAVAILNYGGDVKATDSARRRGPSSGATR